MSPQLAMLQKYQQLGFMQKSKPIQTKLMQLNHH